MLNPCRERRNGGKSRLYGQVGGERAARRRRILWVQRYVLNPRVKLVVWSGVVPGYVLVETTGRRSERRRHTVVGMHIEGQTGWVVAEHGRHAGYVRNLEGNPQVRVRLNRRWQSARAEVIEDDDPQRRLDSFGWRSHAAAVRRFGTDLTTIRFEFLPTAESSEPRTAP